MLIWAISGKYTYPLSVTLEDREPMVFFRKGQIANFGKKTPQVQRKTPQEILIIHPSPTKLPFYLPPSFTKKACKFVIKRDSKEFLEVAIGIERLQQNTLVKLRFLDSDSGQV